MKLWLQRRKLVTIHPTYLPVPTTTILTNLTHQGTLYSHDSRQHHTNWY
jgi:hypothetical protein